jgi:hypothetical protein
LSNIQYNQDLQGELNPRTLVAKEGAKLESQELEIESVVPKFQEGAKLQP